MYLSISGFGLSFFSMWFVPRRILQHESSTISSNDSSVVHQHQTDTVAPWICWARDGLEICRYPASLNSCPCRIAESNILTNVSAYHRRGGFGTLKTHTNDFKASDIRRDKEATISENYVDSPFLDLNNNVSNQKHYADTVVYESDDKLTPCFYTDCEDEQTSTSGVTSEGLENAAMLQLKVENVHASKEGLDYINSTFEGFKPGHSTAICLLNCTQVSDTSFKSENSGPETMNVTEMMRSQCGSRQKIIPDLAFSLSFVLLITGKSLYSASTRYVALLSYSNHMSYFIVSNLRDND